MYRRFTFKPAVLITLLAISLMFGAVLDGYAGGPLPSPKAGGPILVGKGVDGLLNSVAVEGEVVQYIVLACKEADVVLGPAIDQYSTDPGNIGDTTAECSGAPGELCVEGLIFGDVFSTAPLDSPLFDCFPEGDATTFKDLFITRVKNFINTGTAISAEVTLQAGQQQ